jgi:glutamyl-tRNA synthetase
MTLVTRFAPSPTGFLHIGGARTALFNWLYARGRGGKMLLRIEDTDRERSTQAAIDAILDGLTWLGIDWDGDTVYQFSRSKRHREVAEQLLAAGHAYRCYANPEELAQMREAARREGRAKLYDGRWRDRDPSEAPPGAKPAIRLKAPLTGETVIEDQVQGRVVWQNENLDDLVLLRSDGTPTYMLAVVVDDHDMAVTHVIRGDDHLTNAARQKQIYDALGWPVPVMAHIPLIHGPDGSKLSKRHGALGIDAYRAMGYLPAALRNYLVRLGWSHGDQEIFSTDEMIAAFDLPQIGRSPARFDFPKLENLDGHYIRQTSDTDLLTAIDQLLPHLPDGPTIAAKWTAQVRQRLLAAMPSLKERAKTLLDIIKGAGFLYADRPIRLEEKANEILTAGVRSLLSYLKVDLEAVEPWTAEATERALRTFAESTGNKLGSVAQPLRAALTGTTTSPGIFEVLAILGRDESLTRIGDQAAPFTRAISRAPNVFKILQIESASPGDQTVRTIAALSNTATGLSQTVTTAAALAISYLPASQSHGVAHYPVRANVPLPEPLNSQPTPSESNPSSIRLTRNSNG